MDDFTRGHLERWIEANVQEDEQSAIRIAIHAFVKVHTDIVDRMSWPEIRELAERRL